MACASWKSDDGVDWTKRAIVITLISEDLELYRELLGCENLTEHHTAPLLAKPDRTWLAKEMLALDVGYPVDPELRATISSVNS